MENSEKKELALKVGKYYKNRMGKVVKITEHTPGSDYPYLGDSNLTYTAQGFYFPDSGLTDNDLIEEILKLEVEKTYKTREGESVHIISMREYDTDYPFEGDNGQSYTENGLVYDDATDDDDLIEEVCYTPQFNSSVRWAISDNDMSPPPLMVRRTYDDLADSLRGCFATVVEPTNPKDLVGVKKPRLSFIPAAALAHQALAHEDGNNKYGKYNWRENKVEALIYIDAALRHISCYLDGEECAKDSGVHHLGHAAACCNILLDAIETGNLIDDRPIKGKAAEVLERLTKC